MGRRPKPKSEDVFEFTIGFAEIFAILCYETAGKVLHSSGAPPLHLELDALHGVERWILH